MKRNQHNRLDERTQNILSTIDMRSAYEQVIKSNHISLELEKRFRQFTSSELNKKN